MSSEPFATHRSPHPKPQKPPKLQRCFVKAQNSSFATAVDQYGTLSVELNTWQTELGALIWGALAAGASGGKKKITKFTWRCLPSQLFYAVLLVILEREGQSILIDKTKKGVEKRTVEEGDFKTLESLTQFHKKHPQKGFDNCRVVTKKGVTFINVFTHFKAVHTLKDDGDIQYADFEITVCSINPEAVVTLDNSIATTAANMETLIRYCRTFPIRARKKGIQTDPALIAICAAQARKHQSKGGNTSTITSTSNNASVTDNSTTTSAEKGLPQAKRRKKVVPTITTTSTLSPEALPQSKIIQLPTIKKESWVCRC